MTDYQPFLTLDTIETDWVKLQLRRMYDSGHDYEQLEAVAKHVEVVHGFGVLDYRHDWSLIEHWHELLKPNLERK